MPEDCGQKLKEISLSWLREGGKAASAFLTVLPDKTVLVGLPDYGPYHLHFGIGRPTAGTVRFFLQITDQRHPEKTADRRIELKNIGPLSLKDFGKWQERVIRNIDKVAGQLIQLFVESIQLRSFDDLQAQGWRELPTIPELLKSQHSKNGKVKLGHEAIQAIVTNTPSIASDMLALPGATEDADFRGIAYRVSTMSIKVDDIKLDLKLSIASDTTPPWIIEFHSKFTAWMRSQVEKLGEGPAYFVGDIATLNVRCADLLEIILDCAIESFEDKGIREWISMLRAELAIALKENKKFDVEKVFGIDPKLIENPDLARNPG